VTRLQFGEYVFDADARELRRRDGPVPLSPKAFQLLQLLVENSPRALSKSELHDRLWPDTFVVEANLSNLIGEVRRALGDDPQRPRFIRTVHRFGYAFRDVAARFKQDARGGILYRLLWTGGRALLGDGEHIIGRDPDVAVVLDSPSVSRHHAQICVAGARAVLEDLGSKNGSFVGSRRIDRPTDLTAGDVITIGVIELKFAVCRPAASTQTIAGTLVDRSDKA